MQQASSCLPLSRLHMVGLEVVCPVEFACLVLDQLGARVTLVCLASRQKDRNPDCRRSVARQQAACLRGFEIADRDQEMQALSKSADALTEGSRPGTLEHLGMSPLSLLNQHRQLVIGRCSWWANQPERQLSAGHYINSLALFGVLSTIGTREHIVPLLNLIGGFGGASMHLALGIVVPILRARDSGQGAVAETRILASVLTLSTGFQGLRRAKRHIYLLDRDAPSNRYYRRSDCRWMAVGAIESQIFKQLDSLLGVHIDLTCQYDRTYWSEMESELARCIFWARREAHGTQSKRAATPVLRRCWPWQKRLTLLAKRSDGGRRYPAQD